MLKAEDIKADIEHANRLHKEALAKMQDELDRVMQEEAKVIIAQMRADIKKYLITAKDLGFHLAKGRSKARSKVPPKMTHPDGRTWSGRGTKPTWVRELESKL